MVDQAKINQMKKNGEIVLTIPTFKKSVEVTQDNTGKTIYRYKGNNYSQRDWLLTYAHKQYERLIP